MSQPTESALLINSGNTCYINASLQILYQILYTGGKLPRHDHDNQSDIIDCWTCKILSMMRCMNGSVGDALIPDVIISLIGNLGEKEKEFDLKIGKECDAFSLLCLIVERCGMLIFWREFKTFKTSGEYVSDGSGYAFMITLEVDDDSLKTTQELLDESFIRGESDTREEVFKPPDFAWLYIARFLTFTNPVGQKVTTKLLNKVLVLDELSITCGTEVVQYDVVGSINHVGNSIKHGHYITYIKSGTLWQRIEDALVPTFTDSLIPQEPYLIFYKKRGYDPNSVVLSGSRQISSSSYKNPLNEISIKPSVDGKLTDEDDYINSHQNEPTLILHNGGTEIERCNYDRELEKATRKDVETLVTTSKVMSISRIWKLIMFVPKHVAGKKSSFKSRFENLGKNLEIGQIDNVLYTISYERALFQKQLMQDSYFANNYDAYSMDIVKGVGYKTLGRWIASVFIGHILHTRYMAARNGIKFEFIFDWNSKCQVPVMLRKEYRTIREYSVELCRHLPEDNLFCIDQCTSQCHILNRPHHLNLMTMSLNDYETDLRETIFNRIYLRWTEHLSPHHPFYHLFNFETVEPDASLIEENFRKVITDLDMYYIRDEVVVYVFLIVTPFYYCEEKVTANALYNLSGCQDSIKKANFHLYAGLSGLKSSLSEGYRKDHFHFKPENHSSVFKVLRRNSTVYNFFSIRYQRSKGPSIEAAWIEIIKGIQFRNSFLHEIQTNKIENVVRARTAYFGCDDELDKNVKMFVSGKQKLFHFIGDPTNSEPLPMEISGCYKISDDMEIKFKKSFRDRLPLGYL